MVTGLVLAEVLDLLDDDQGPHSTHCPINRGHLNHIRQVRMYLSQ